MKNRANLTDDGKVRDIRDWLLRYAKFSSRLFSLGTFPNANMSPLFTESNLELQSSENDSAQTLSSDHLSAMYDRTGFVCRAVVWENGLDDEDMDSESKTSNSLNREVLGKYSFLSDWERLWNYLVEDDSDEIAVQLPFFRAVIELIFHFRVLQLAYFLYIWNLGLFICLIIHYSHGTEGVTFANFISITLEFVVYLIMVATNKGPNSIRPFYQSMKRQARKRKMDTGRKEDDSACNSPSRDMSTAPEVDDREVAVEVVDHEFSLWSTIRRVWRRGKREVSTIFSTSTDSAKASKSQKSDKRRNLYYYRWLNTAMKVLTKDYGVNIDEINFNRRSYRFVVFFTVALFPIYVVISGYVGVSTAWATACSQGSNEALGQQSCDFYMFEFIFSCFGLTLFIQQILFGTSVLITLAGLAYGCEISFRLAECWTQKYHSLRRIETVHNGLTSNSNGKGNITPWSVETDRDIDGSDPADEQEGLLKTKLEDSHATGGISTTSHENKQKGKKKAWMKKLRRGTAMAIDTEGTVVLPQDIADMQELITRDATEHYLFICELLKKAGEIWSPALTFFMFLTLYVCLSDLIFLVELAGVLLNFATLVMLIHTVFFVTVRVLFLFIYPILAIAFANSYLIKMTDVFRVADRIDYQLIGGRDRWLQIFAQSPAAWTFFGLWITPSRLIAVLWTSLVALGGVFLSSIIANSS